jgi:sulfur relay protein TusB/DsrH
MPTLFLISHAPHADPHEGQKIALAKPGDAVVLMEDAVYAAGAAETPFSPAIRDGQSRGVSLYALTADLLARGVTTELSQVDYDGLVDLIAAHERVVH